MPKFKLKANKENSSRSIIVAFHSKWYEPMKTGEFSVVFRKFGPRAFQPDYIYAYVAQPISAIVARMEVTTYQSMSIEDATKMASKGLLTDTDLRSYGARFAKLYVFGIGAIQMAKHSLTMSRLAKDYDYWPDSTFIPLSEVGKRTIDDICGFIA